MAIPELQLRACLKAVGEFLEKRRPPAELRDRLDLRTNIIGSEVVILEVRPAFRDEGRSVEHAVAKVKWVNSREIWRLFWMRADLKWHTYEPLPEAAEISTVLSEIDRDPHGCFFG